MLGEYRAKVVSAHIAPDFDLVGEGVERLGWIESGQVGGKVASLYFTARLINDVVWSVGIRSEDYYFLIQTNDEGDHYFSAVPKAIGDDRRLANWVGRRNGFYENLGVEL